MQISAREIANIIGGQIEGNPDILISKPSKIEEGTIGAITFLANPKYESFIYSTDASAIIVPLSFKPSKPLKTTLIRVEDVYSSVGVLLNQFNHSEILTKGISKVSEIADTAVLGDNVSIGSFTIIKDGVVLSDNCMIYPQVFIGSNVQIGKNTIVYPGVRIYHDCVVGDDCVIHANTVIGSDGFGYAKSGNDFAKIPQIGNVVLEDQVEIGANTVIDRATMGSTIIKKGAKLDNLIQIAHNVEIGENSAIAAQAGIAGSAKVGKDVMVGGQVGIAGHLTISDRSQIQAKSGISSSVKKDGSKLYGYPAIEYRQYLKAYSVFRNLPQLTQQLDKLEKEVLELRKRLRD